MSHGVSGVAADIAEAAHHGGAEAEVFINGDRVHLTDAVPTARQLLSAGGFDPASDHVLIRALDRSSVSIGLDETVDMRHGGMFTFFAFASDRVFSFTVDERGYEWGADEIAEERLRKLASVPDAKVILLEREDAPDLELEPGDTVRLGKKGTEHLKTRKGMVTVSYNGDDREIPRGVYTTEQLMTLLGVENGYVLDVMKDGQLVSLKPGEKVRVKQGMKFISQAPCGGSS